MSLEAAQARDGERKQNWRTPWGVVRGLARRFAGGDFDLDAAADDDNHKAPGYLTEEDDALSQPWWGRVWCNPPYQDIDPWVEHAIREVDAGRAEVVVMLLPARTGTEWYARARASGLCRIEPIRGRVQFLAADGQPWKGNFEWSVVLVIARPLEARELVAGGMQLELLNAPAGASLAGDEPAEAI